MSDKKSVSVRLNGKNFPSWKFHIQTIIRFRKLENVIFSEVKDEDAVANADKELEAQELLVSGLDQNIIAEVITCTTANQIWTRLCSIHQLKGEGNVEALLNRFWKLQMSENEDVSSWIGRVEMMATELRESNQVLSDLSVRARLIAGLTPKFQGFARAWNSTAEKEKTLQNLIDRLITYYNLHQQNYTQSILKKFNMSDCKTTSAISIDVNDLLHVSTTDQSATGPYRNLIGALNYLACLSRPDIAFVVSMLSRFNNNPQQKHWNAAKAVLRYIKDTQSHGLLFQSDNGKQLNINIYSDADWGGDPITRKSTTGMLIEISGGPIAFKSKLQAMIATTTTEAEFIAANQTVREVKWLNNLLSELKIDTINNLFLDNQAAIRMIKTDEYRSRTKHLDIKYKFIQEQFKQKLFDINYIPTNLQKADILTKILPPTKRKNMLKLIGVLINPKNLVVLLTLSSVLPPTSSFHHEDTIIWRKTPITLVDGYAEYEMKFAFHSPCMKSFDNMTGVPYVDLGLVNVCEKRFKEDIINPLNEIRNSHNRPARDGGASVAVILALSAIYVSTHSTVSMSRKVNRDNEAKENMIRQLDEKVALIQQKFILSSERISSKIDWMERDLNLIAEVTAIQPVLVDALSQLFMRMNQDNKKLQTIKKQLKVGEPMPHILIELFNLTDVVSDITVRHSNVIGFKVDDHVILPQISSAAQIMKADSFKFREKVGDKLCTFEYVGPEYTLVNTTTKCIRPLMRSEIVDDLVIGTGCHRRTLNTTTLYEPRNCYKSTSSNFKRMPVQLKHDGVKLRINCQEHSITVNNVKSQCPNFIFSLEHESSFSIDDFSYRYSRTNLSMKESFEIPNHINLHLGTPRREFHALDATDIETLEAHAAKIKAEKLNKEIEDGEESTDWLNFSNIGNLSGYIDSLFTKIGSHIGMISAFFLIYLLCTRRDRNNRIPVAQAGIPLLIVFLSFGTMLVLCENQSHQIRMSLNAEQATKEISILQQRMTNEKCNFWELSKDYNSWMHQEGHYAVTLSCALANLKITCPCDSSDEYIPIVSENKLEHIEKFINTDCPVVDKREEYGAQLKLFETTSEYLCNQSHIDPWSRDHYGQLIAAGCILSKKAYNCHCHGGWPHKNIYRDLLTIANTQTNLTARIEACKHKTSKLFEQKQIEDSTIYARFYAKNKHLVA